MNAQNMAKGMNDVHNLIDALVQQAAHEGWEDREVYSIDVIRMQNELREKYAGLQQQLAAAREALQAAEADAARYRWLRSSAYYTQGVAPAVHITDDNGVAIGAYDDDEMDEVIDGHIEAIAATIDATLQRDRQP